MSENMNVMESADTAVVIPRNFANNEDEAISRYDMYKGSDPYPDIDPSLLNSADILAYVKATSLIHPFDVGCLKGASYDVKIFGEVVYWDEDGKKISSMLDNKNAYFDLCPNSIAFVTVEPTFRIPYYLALRFNLKIKHIYKGLLLGTGPLVDPGFVGKLSIPLHNLTSNTYRFHAFDDLITMEFTKMSTHKQWNINAPDIPENYIINEIDANRSVSEYIGKSLKRDGLNTVISSIPDAMLESKKSVEAAKEAVVKLEKAAGRQALISVIAVCALVMSCVAFSLNAINKANDRYDALRNEYGNTIVRYETRINDLEAKIDDLLELVESGDQIEGYEPNNR